MKRLISALLALAMLLFAAALAEGESYLGLWYLNSIQTDGNSVSMAQSDAQMTLNLKSDGTATFVQRGGGENETTGAKWTGDATGGELTSAGQTLYFSVAGDRLLITDRSGGDPLEFTRSRPTLGKTNDLSRAIVSVRGAVYTGRDVYPTVTVTMDRQALSQSRDYTLKYSGNRSVGKGTVTVTGVGAYTGTVQAYFDIVPKGTKVAKLVARKKGFGVKWNRQAAGTSGYQIQYSVNKNFKSAKTRTVGKTATTTLEIGNLKAKQRYYVRVRTYTKVGKRVYYSDWSAAKTVTTKK